VRTVPTAGADEGAGSEPDQSPDEGDGGNKVQNPLEQSVYFGFEISVMLALVTPDGGLPGRRGILP
jgi:hypothetical protein